MKAWILLVLLFSFPAFGRELDQGRVNIPLGRTPVFRFPDRERMTVKVIVSGGNFGGHSSTDYGRWLESEITRQVMSLAPARNISVFQGTPRPGYLVLEVTAKVLSGRDYNRSYRSSSRSDSWRGSYQSTSNSGRDAREWTGTYLTLSPVLYRIGVGDQKEVVAAPVGRISASDSEMTSSMEDYSSQRSESYGWRRGSSSTYRAEEAGHEWRNDEEMAREMQADGLISRLALQTTNQVFNALQKTLELEKYNEIKDREGAAIVAPSNPKTQPAMPAKKEEKPFRYTIENE